MATEDKNYFIKHSTLYSIAESIRAKTGKTDTITPFEMAAEIEGIFTGGGGSGECSGSHVIEVTELPTENIDENAVYRPSIGIKVFSDVILINSGTAISVRNVEGGNYVYCTTKPTENLVEYTLYYVEDEDTVYSCYNGELNDLKAQYNYLGVISSASQASTDVDGAYVVITTDAEGCFYTYSGETVLTDLVVFTSGDVISYKELIESILGVTVEIHTISTRATEGVLESTETGLYLYYIKDENVVDAYMEGQWGDPMPVNGIVSNIGEVPPVEGFYLIGTVGGWTKYIEPRGSIAVTENGIYAVTDLSSVIVDVPLPSGSITINNNGTYDVKDYASATVSMPTISIVQTFSKLSSSAPYGSIAIVLEGGK